MQSLFGLPINTLMIALAAVFIATLLVVLGMAIRNRVMLKMGLRPIPRRPGMTALIIIGVMLSTVIISAAFGTGDTLAFSIRNIAISDLKNIDELVIRTRAPAAEGDTFGQIFMDFQIYEDLYKDLMDDEHLKAVGMFERHHHPTEGETVLVRPPVLYEKSPASIRTHAPRYGEHGQAVLREIRYGESEIEALIEAGALIPDDGVQEAAD